MNENVNSFDQNHSTLAHSDSGWSRTAYCPFYRQPFLHSQHTSRSGFLLTQHSFYQGNPANRQPAGGVSVAVAVTPVWSRCQGEQMRWMLFQLAESDCKSAPREGLLALVEVESPTEADATILTTLPVHSPHRGGAAGHSSCGHSTNPVGGGDTAQKKQQLYHINVNTGKMDSLESELQHIIYTGNVLAGLSRGADHIHSFIQTCDPQRTNNYVCQRSSEIQEVFDTLPPLCGLRPTGPLSVPA